MSLSSSRAARKPSAVMGWHPTYPAQEQSIVQMLNARQVALRHLLRTHYWLSDCKPLSAAQIERTRQHMARLDPQDTMPDPQVDEVINPDFGFEKDGGTWVIPDLLDRHTEALASIERKSAAGRASAAARVGKVAPTTPAQTPHVSPVQAGDPDDF